MKKTLALLLAALLALSCFACEPTPDPGESKINQYADPTVTDSDKFTYNVWDMDLSYALPKIVYEKSGTDALNQAIRDTLYVEYISKVKAPIEKEDLPTYGSMSYTWGYKNGYLSIAEFCPIFASEGQELYVFNIDLNTMAMTDAFTLLKAYDITKDAFLTHAKEIIAQTMYENLKGELTTTDYYAKLMAETVYAKTLGDENIAHCEPFIGEGGKLMVKCSLGSLYGADEYAAFLPYDTALAGDAKAFYEAFDFGSAGKFDVSVTDGELITRYYEGIDETCKFNIPKIVCPKGQEDKMNQILRAAIDAAYGNTFSTKDVPSYCDLTYKWGVNENILSVCLFGDQPYSGWTECWILNFNVVTGEQVGTDEVLALYGIYDTDEFFGTVRDRMGSEYVDRRGGKLSEQAETIQGFNYTVDMGNVRLAVPFIGEDGSLWFLGQFGQEAGATYSWQTFPYEGTVSSAYKTEYNKIRVVDGENIHVTYTDHGYGAKYGNFTVPKIIARQGKQDTANATLLAFVKEFLGDSIVDTEHGGAYTSIHYIWGVKDQYVSVVIWSHYGESDYEQYAALTINTVTGKAIEDSALLKLYGITDTETYRKQVMDRMGTVYVSEHGDEEIDSLFLAGFELTCEFNHVYLARPYIGEDGTLWIAAPIGKGAGSGIDWHTLPYKGTVSEAYKNLYAQYIATN